MELVEGETLAERISRGPIPASEALPISQQIAEALEAAHEKGVIHRDLKTANIKVDPEGKVKVLDFDWGALHVAPHMAAVIRRCQRAELSGPLPSRQVRGELGPQ